MTPEDKDRSSGVFPRAKPEERYQGGLASKANPLHPAGAPAPATVLARPDPNAVPSNVRQREEVREKEDREWDERHPPAASTDRQFQQPGSPSQQVHRHPGDPEELPVSEQTKREQEAGRKAVEAAESARAEARTLAEAGETGEQLEAKRKEAEEQRKTWGEGGTIAGTVPGEVPENAPKAGETPPPPPAPPPTDTTTPPPPPPAEPTS